MVMVDCCRAGDLPDGAVNLVVGPTAATYAPIMASPKVRKVSLTGSTRVGQQMIRDAADTMKKVTMELGGNAPLIVYDDADLETALDVCAAHQVRQRRAGLRDRLTASSSTRACTTPLSMASWRGRRRLKLGDGLDPDGADGARSSTAAGWSEIEARRRRRGRTRARRS